MVITAMIITLPTALVDTDPVDRPTPGSEEEG